LYDQIFIAGQLALDADAGSKQCRASFLIGRYMPQGGVFWLSGFGIGVLEISSIGIAGAITGGISV
jgi:hypothetical protein